MKGSRIKNTNNVGTMLLGNGAVQRVSKETIFLELVHILMIYWVARPFITALFVAHRNNRNGTQHQ